MHTRVTQCQENFLKSQYYSHNILNYITYRKVCSCIKDVQNHHQVSSASKCTAIKSELLRIRKDFKIFISYKNFKQTTEMDH